jgi:hypothetical protein
MRFAALRIPDPPILGGIESSPGYLLVEIEAEDSAAAEAFCTRSKLRYVMPLVLQTIGCDRRKGNGHGG